MDRQTARTLKKIELEIGYLHKEDRLLRERIAAAAGLISEDFRATSSFGGILSADDGISGGGTFPGTVHVAVDLNDDWSGLEFEDAQLRVDEDEEFVWLQKHIFRKACAELRASHFAMGEAHGLGGTTYIAPCGGLRSALMIG